MGVAAGVLMIISTAVGLGQPLTDCPASGPPLGDYETPGEFSEAGDRQPTKP